MQQPAFARQRRIGWPVASCPWGRTLSLTVLFGHPSGAPFAYHAAFAHYAAGRLEAFCVPWMPSASSLDLLEKIVALRPMVQRLRRRHFAPLLAAPLVQGRAGEFKRLALRLLGLGDEGLSYEANDWLMRTMRRESRRPTVTAVHSYEDCSLWQFVEAKKQGKACIYDLPIGYYPAWQETLKDLTRRYADWLPQGGLPSSRYVRPEQKRREMELADLVLAPGSFVANTVRAFHSDKRIAIAPYGVDTDFWCPGPVRNESGKLRFLNAGQLSVRKGIPDLLEAWAKAAIPDAELHLVGAWCLAENRRRALPPGVILHPPCGSQTLREHYRQADVFVFPSYFEGFGLVLLEAMACGLPAIASEATAGPDILADAGGRLIPVGDVDALVESLRWFCENRDRLPEMLRAARARAQACSWERYRHCVGDAVALLA